MGLVEDCARYDRIQALNERIATRGVRTTPRVRICIGLPMPPARIARPRLESFNLAFPDITGAPISRIPGFPGEPEVSGEEFSSRRALPFPTKRERRRAPCTPPHRFPGTPNESWIDRNRVSPTKTRGVTGQPGAVPGRRAGSNLISTPAIRVYPRMGDHQPEVGRQMPDRQTGRSVRRQLQDR